MDDLIKIGYTQKPHGLNGELKVFVEEKYEDDFSDCETVFLEIKGKNLPYFVDRVRGGNFIIVKFDGVNTKEDALALQGKTVFIRESDLSETTIEEIETEDALRQMIGFTMMDKTFGTVGEIIDIVELPHQEMFLVKDKNKEFYIPMTEAYIIDIDERRKVVTMDLPDGLIGL